MPKIIKDNALADDQWQVVAKDADSFDGAAILPLALWLQQPNRSELALWLDSDESPQAIDVDVASIPLIAINFPAFTDGRGFSYGRQLREAGFNGELRAIGQFMRDQLFFLKRCGFNAFALNNSELESALESLNDFSAGYQASVDQPEPLFRR
jgi:uncharacterized protein (DUF934 family)